MNCTYIHINTYCKLPIETVKEEPNISPSNNIVPKIIIDGEDAKRKEFLYCLSERSKLWKNSTGLQFTISQLQEALLYISESKWISKENRCLHFKSYNSSDMQFLESYKYANKDQDNPSDGDNHSKFNDIPNEDINEEPKWLENKIYNHD